jgi:hypothetical protein
MKQPPHFGERMVDLGQLAGSGRAMGRPRFVLQFTDGLHETDDNNYRKQDFRS